MWILILSVSFPLMLLVYLYRVGCILYPLSLVAFSFVAFWLSISFTLMIFVLVTFEMILRRFHSHNNIIVMLYKVWIQQFLFNTFSKKRYVADPLYVHSYTCISLFPSCYWFTWIVLDVFCTHCLLLRFLSLRSGYLSLSHLWYLKWY